MSSQYSGIMSEQTYRYDADGNDDDVHDDERMMGICSITFHLK